MSYWNLPANGYRLAEIVGTVLPGSPVDFRKLIAEETNQWGKVIKLVGIKPECRDRYRRWKPWQPSPPPSAAATRRRCAVQCGHDTSASFAHAFHASQPGHAVRKHFHASPWPQFSAEAKEKKNRPLSLLPHAKSGHFCYS
jgi:hypothetical protein